MCPELKKKIEELLAKVIIDPDTDCWHWTGATDGNGYGEIFLEGKRVKVHRLFWMWKNLDGYEKTAPEGLIKYECLEKARQYHRRRLTGKPKSTTGGMFGNRKSDPRGRGIKIARTCSSLRCVNPDHHHLLKAEARAAMARGEDGKGDGAR